jgi:hypothetical protein
MSDVTLKLGGKAVIKCSGGEAEIGTWDYVHSSGKSKFEGRTNDGRLSGLMKKRELREWFAKECAK